jgi:SAM-dependent methyltransferase
VNPLTVYETALRRGSDGSAAPLRFVTDRGETRTVDAARWCADGVPGDAGIVARCLGPTLDVGCGPGRLAAAVAARGVPALGVDLSPVAIRLSHAKGALALRRDVFDRLPGERRWAHVLLADGNIGIGGDPVRLLRRCRELLDDTGIVIVETEPVGAATDQVSLRLHHDGHRSDPFRWAFVAADALAPYATAADLTATDTWTEAGRWFTQLSAA